MIEAVFNTAYFWRVPPREIYGLTLDEFDEYQRQAARIAELISKH